MPAVHKFESLSAVHPYKVNAKSKEIKENNNDGVIWFELEVR